MTNQRIFLANIKPLSERDVIWTPPFEAIRLQKRVFKKIDDKVIPEYINTNSYIYILRFRASCIPKSAVYYGKRVYLDPFIYKVRRCNVCQCFGHTMNTCKMHSSGKTICARCGKSDHEKTSCSSPSPFCINCHREGFDKGKHEASDIKCPAFLRRKKIHKIMAIKNVSYKEEI